MSNFHCVEFFGWSNFAQFCPILPNFAQFCPILPNFVKFLLLQIFGLLLGDICDTFWSHCSRVRSVPPHVRARFGLQQLFLIIINKHSSCCAIAADDDHCIDGDDDDVRDDDNVGDVAFGVSWLFGRQSKRGGEIVIQGQSRVDGFFWLEVVCYKYAAAAAASIICPGVDLIVARKMDSNLGP